MSDITYATYPAAFGAFPTTGMSVSSAAAQELSGIRMRAAVMHVGSNPKNDASNDALGGEVWGPPVC